MIIGWFGFSLIELADLDFYNGNGASWSKESYLSEIILFYEFLYWFKRKTMC